MNSRNKDSVLTKKNNCNSSDQKESTEANKENIENKIGDTEKCQYLPLSEGDASLPRTAEDVKRIGIKLEEDRQQRV